MKTVVLLLSSVLLAVTVRGTIVYDNLGPGGTYDRISAYGIFQGPTNFAGYAAQFTAGASGLLDTVDLGLQYGSTFTMPVNVFLVRNANGSAPPGNDRTFLGSGAPTSYFDGTSNSTLLSITVAGNVSVTLGSSYWLELEGVPPNIGELFWNLSSPAVIGFVSNSFNSGGFSGGLLQTLPAFRITAQPVPEPNGSSLLLLGLLAALFVSKKGLPGRKRL